MKNNYFAQREPHILSVCVFGERESHSAKRKTIDEFTTSKCTHHSLDQQILQTSNSFILYCSIIYTKRDSSTLIEFHQKNEAEPNSTETKMSHGAKILRTTRTEIERNRKRKTLKSYFILHERCHDSTSGQHTNDSENKNVIDKHEITNAANAHNKSIRFKSFVLGFFLFYTLTMA